VCTPGGTCPILRATADGDVWFILPDQNDAPSEEVSPSGELAWTARKGTWGEGFNAVGASGGEPALGQWYDAESGLHYNFFRYYDPDVGRFLSPDPIDLLGGLNLYLAVSDPYGQYDRFGLAKAPGGCPPSAPEPAVPPKALTRREALAKAQAHAQVPRESKGGVPIPFGELNDGSRGANTAALKRVGATTLGRRDPESKAEFFDHPDGHPNLTGAGQPSHHAEPHVHATKANGATIVIVYKAPS